MAKVGKKNKTMALFGKYFLEGWCFCNKYTIL